MSLPHQPCGRLESNQLRWGIRLPDDPSCQMLDARHQSVCAPRWPPSDLMSGQVSHDWGEGVGDVSAEDEVGEADLLASSLNLLGGR
jgi:hypothetical protein